jgi:ketosteroid isomerase-like protein
MSEQRIAVVCRACEAWGTGELSVLYDLYTPDVTADGGRLWFETESIVTGVDAVVAGFATLIDAFEENDLVPEAVVEHEDTLVVPLLWRGRAAGSTEFVEQRLIGAFTFRGEQIAQMAWFQSVQDALDAVGLPRSAAERMREIAPAPGASGV